MKQLTVVLYCTSVASRCNAVTLFLFFWLPLLVSYSTLKHHPTLSLAQTCKVFFFFFLHQTVTYSRKMLLLHTLLKTHYRGIWVFISNTVKGHSESSLYHHHTLKSCDKLSPGWVKMTQLWTDFSFSSLVPVNPQIFKLLITLSGTLEDLYSRAVPLFHVMTPFMEEINSPDKLLHNKTERCVVLRNCTALTCPY